MGGRSACAWISTSARTIRGTFTWEAPDGTSYALRYNGEKEHYPAGAFDNCGMDSPEPTPGWPEGDSPGSVVPDAATVDVVYDVADTARRLYCRLEAVTPEWVNRGERTPDERRPWTNPLNRLSDAVDLLDELAVVLRGTGGAS